MVEKKSTKAKSTPKKRAAKKVEVSQPVSEPRQAEPVQSQINWDVIGFSSAGVTLTGAALLFMLGWAYEVNWYGYFGVSISQINPQPQQILIYSLPAIVSLLTYFLGAVFIYISVFRLKIRWEEVSKSKKLEKTSLVSPRIIFSPLSGMDWIIILVVTEAFSLLFMYVDQAITHHTDIIIKPYEISYLQFIGSYLFIAIGLSFLINIFRIIRIDAVNNLKNKVVNYLFEIKTIQRNILILLLSISIILTSFATAAQFAINDASRGFRGSGGWVIQPMMLIKPEILPLSESISQRCANSICISGPYGLIGENDSSFILIKWKGDIIKTFNHHPGFYVIPKSPETYLIPYDYSLSNLNEAVTIEPTATIQPTSIPTATPTITSTAVATETMKP